MQFGPRIGSIGAIAHASTWYLLHSQSCTSPNQQCRTTPPSFGYILGMVPCAALAGKGIRCQSFQMHPIAISAIGQLACLLAGTLWISMIDDVDNNSGGRQRN